MELMPGSSPLTRGKRGSPDDLPSGHRLIPAHAGKTFGTLPPNFAFWAHPRSRGENATWLVWPVPEGGSSPLTRGKPQQVQGSLSLTGLIPAHAGKTRIQLLARR